MERGGGPGEGSRIAAKTPRTSSGCLSLKKKSDGVSRTVSSTGIRPKFQKRSRVIVSDSESSDEFMKPALRRAKVSSEEKLPRKRSRVEQDRNGYVRRNNEASGSLMKMNKIDVFEFDEYDGFDSANLRKKGFDNDGVGLSGRSSSASRRVDSSVGRSGSGRDGPFARRKKAYVNGSSTMSSQEKLSSESDPDEPIRVQGRNGVLKVKVNNKTSTLAACVMSSQEKLSIESDSDEPMRVQGRNGVLKVKVYNKTSTLAASNNHQVAEIYERPPSSIKAQKHENVVVKPIFRISNNVDNNSESEESDMSRKSEYSKPKKEINSSSKSKSTFSEPVKPEVRKERRGKRGGGTEKQRLRERIKGMLTDAGWTIDYRPRRNQSYLDAVYVNPSGTAYWSIIKAYDALLKQLKDEEIDARPRKDAAVVASVSEDIVNNLARKAKKTRIEMTKKRKNISSGSDSENESDGDDDGGEAIDIPEERISSFVKLAGKSTKTGRNGVNWDELHSKSKRSIYYDDARPSSGSDSHYLHGRKSRKIGRCTLLVRSSKDKKNPAIDGFNPYSGKRTVLSWLIESGIVKLRQKVQYMNARATKVMLEGWITREGIHCICCSKILTLSRFEIHAGSKSCQPFQNIFLESGASLLQCQVRAWNIQKDATNLGFHQVDTDGDDPNDDACGICGDGGDLICCDGCPSTYHQTCLGMQVLPSGDWHCPNCTCKFCDAAVDSGGEEGNLLPLLSCSMCERRYHQSCMRELEAHKVQSFGSDSSFCGPKCFELFEELQKYLGVKNKLEDGYSWSLIHRVDTDSDTNSQLPAKRIENNSKLAVGLAIMDECFLPIIDRRSGVNLIRNVLYNCGSNFSRINYTGFYTAILERGDEIISAASLRFHGMQLAEMPFIGTRHIYRRQGMCRRLFDAIETALRSLKVEKLVIPAIPDFLHAWTGNFGFSPLDDSVRKEMRSLSTLVFPGIDMLQKPLLHEENVTTAVAASDLVVVHNGAMNSEIVKKSEFASSVKIGPYSIEGGEFVADAANCYKNILASDEENIPVLVETAIDTICKPEDELRRYFTGEECVINSSSCTKLSEDTKASCEDGLIDINVEADASLAAEEIQQASADYKACSDFLVENNLSSSVSCKGSSYISSISQEANKSEQNSLNVDNDILGAGAKLAESKDDAFADGFLL